MLSLLGWSCLGLSLFPGPGCLMSVFFFFPQVKELLSYFVSKYFLCLFLSSPGTPKMWMLLCLMLSQKSLKLPSLLFILFSIQLQWFSILSSRLFIYSLTSFNQLLISSSVFLISVIVVLISVWLFFMFSNSLLETSNLTHPFFSQLLWLSLWSLFELFIG